MAYIKLNGSLIPSQAALKLDKSYDRKFDRDINQNQQISPLDPIKV